MPRPGRAGIRQLFFEASSPVRARTSTGALANWEVFIASPLDLQTESGERASGSNWVPQFERLDEPFEIQDRDRHPRRRLPLHRVDRAEVETAPEAAVGGRSSSCALGRLLRRRSHASSKPSSRSSRAPTCSSPLEGEWSRGELPAGQLHGEGPAPGASSYNFTPERGLVEPRAVRQRTPGCWASRAACAGDRAARATTSSSSSTAAGSTRRTATTCPNFDQRLGQGPVHVPVLSSGRTRAAW